MLPARLSPLAWRPFRVQTHLLFRTWCRFREARKAFAVTRETGAIRQLPRRYPPLQLKRGFSAAALSGRPRYLLPFFNFYVVAGAGFCPLSSRTDLTSLASFRALSQDASQVDYFLPAQPPAPAPTIRSPVPGAPAKMGRTFADFDRELVGKGIESLPEGKVYDSALIWLHGLGDTPAGWQDPMEEFCAHSESINKRMKLILLAAPVRAVEINMNMPTTAWANIYGLSDDSREDEEGFAASADRVCAAIEYEMSVRSIPASNIFLGGFSQGGALTNYVMTRRLYNVRLGGVISLSAWLPLRKAETLQGAKPQNTTPYLMCHGEQDNVVAFAFGEKSYEFMKDKNWKVTFKSYPMAHQACAQEIDDVKDFIEQNMSQ